ncbi:hypothetical protein [Prescottella sp. R16]|uniref:hypothetical protein n=1 Tax=Prescottella sp. R16 TaxID=3064529 RepID=UPI00272EB3D6|nr:hypothetical protein [Prescottella sp. R16]
MSAFSWPQYLWLVTIFVGVPMLFAANMIRSVLRVERADSRPRAGRLGLWATAATAFALGFVACAGWLSWSAYGQGPGLPAPNAFPTWQVVACGATVVAGCFVAAQLSRWTRSGGLAAAAGTTAGFAAAFCVAATFDTTGLSGVGIMFSMVGWGLGLSVLMSLRGALIDRRRSRTHPAHD